VSAILHPIRLVMVLTENQTLVGDRDLSGPVSMAVDAEAAGVDAVMLSEHVLPGPDSGAAGETANPRDYAGPGNQPPSTAWPSSVVLLPAIARATSTLRLVAGAIIAYDLADLDHAMADVPAQLEQGFTSFCFKPAMFVDDVTEVGDLCRGLARRVDLAVGAHSRS